MNGNNRGSFILCLVESMGELLKITLVSQECVIQFLGQPLREQKKAQSPPRRYKEKGMKKVIIAIKVMSRDGGRQGAENQGKTSFCGRFSR